MAGQRRPITRTTPSIGAIGIAMALVLAGLILGALAMLFAQAGEADVASVLGSRYVRRVLQFTVTQACLSTALSVVFGLLVARAFARAADFPGRRALLGLMSLPIVVPSLVAVFGIIAF
jgi:thiamine transport system permease protein